MRNLFCSSFLYMILYEYDHWVFFGEPDLMGMNGKLCASLKMSKVGGVH